MLANPLKNAQEFKVVEVSKVDNSKVIMALQKQLSKRVL